MIITRKKDPAVVMKALQKGAPVFIVGCGECATTCKTGGEKEVLEMKAYLEGAGYPVSGYCVPEAPCVASKLRIMFAKNKAAMEQAGTVIVMACGLGAQSVIDNLFTKKEIILSNDTMFMGQVAKDGGFLERCSACGECILDLTGGICPVTRCPKGIMNGPCGGQEKGKCEVDREKDCAWILIYKRLKEADRLDRFKKMNQPKDHSKARKPRALKA